MQVFGTGGLVSSEPVALGRSATQSSTLPGYATTGAAGAVDGNTDGNFFDGSVTHTNLETNPWWQVDLGASTAVSSIVVWNRTDACCVARLNDYWVFVSDTPFSSTDTPATLQNSGGNIQQSSDRGAQSFRHDRGRRARPLCPRATQRHEQSEPRRSAGVCPIAPKVQPKAAMAHSADNKAQY